MLGQADETGNAQGGEGEYGNGAVGWGKEKKQERTEQEEEEEENEVTQMAGARRGNRK